MRPDGEKPSPEVLVGLAKSFDLMKYDIALLAQDEAVALNKIDIQVDSTRKTERQAPFSVITTSNGDRIGFLRFPSLASGKDIPSENMIRKIGQTIKDKRTHVQLLIALSDWGWVGEREYLAQNPDVVPDILLGSGHGSGVNGRIEADSRCVWIRPYDKGRTVNEVQVYTWPERTKPFAWTEAISIRSLSIGLGDQYEDNPEVGAILQ